MRTLPELLLTKKIKVLAPYPNGTCSVANSVRGTLMRRRYGAGTGLKRSKYG